MKQIFSLLGLLGLCLGMFMLPAVAMQAIAAHNPLAHLSEPLQGNPETNAHNTNLAKIPSTQSSNSMAMSSQQLGLSGQLELAGTYNSLTGVNGSVNYTQAINDSLGFSALGEYGAKMYRFGATGGFKIDSLGLFKVSAERLSQILPFNFTTGSTDQRVYQNAYGARYLKTLKGLLQSVEMGGYYAKAQNQSLNPINYTAGGLSYRNDRNIAGGTSQGADVKINLLLAASSLLKPAINYDSLSYSPAYSSISDNKGLGGGANFTQLLAPNLKADVGVSVRAIGNSYQAALAWLPTQLKRHGIELALKGEHDTFPGAMPSSNSLMLSINLLDLEGGFSHARHYDLASNFTEENINDWVKTPAVKMAQVYAVVDQRNVRLSPITIVITPANASISSAATQQYLATATYPDSSQQDVTSLVSWSSSLTSVATISSSGLANGVAPGTTSISASYLGVSGSTNLNVNSVTPPNVTSISPATGPAAGGTSVTIIGTNFTGATAVNFGTTSASFIFDSDSQITATSPAGSGAVNISVTTPAGISAQAQANLFTYAPTVTSLSVNYGSIAGGTSVVITGTGFIGTVGALGVKFGLNNAATYNVTSNTQITATSPAGIANATVNITVTNGGLTSADTTADDFIYQTTPVITSLDPAAGHVGTSVKIIGTGFLGADGVGGAVNFGGIPAIPYVVNSATQITAVAPGGVAGTASVTVSTGEGTSNGSDFQFN